MSKITIQTLKKYKQEGRKVVYVTAYDYPQALLANSAGVDMILVGDSLGMTTLGYKTTIPVTMEDMISHCSAVARATTSAFIVGDMPFMSYQTSNEEAVRNAGRFITAGADAVKLEGCLPERVKAISDAGILVMGHLGLTPQSLSKQGGYRVAGKSKSQADLLLQQALDLQDAGLDFLLIEAMPAETGEYIAKRLSIPVYGIGAGDKVDGQLVIFHDLVGLFFDFKPKFAKRYCEAGELIQNALTTYAEEVRSGKFPTSEHFYKMPEDEAAKLTENTSTTPPIKGGDCP